MANLFNLSRFVFLMKLKLGTNFAVFVIFFGMALVLSLKNQNWIGAAIFFIIGLVSLLADSKKKR